MEMMYHHALRENLIPQVNLHTAFIYDDIWDIITAVIIEH